MRMSIFMFLVCTPACLNVSTPGDLPAGDSDGLPTGDSDEASADEDGSDAVGDEDCLCEPKACVDIDPYLYEGGTATCASSCSLDLSDCQARTQAGELQSCGGSIGCTSGLTCGELPQLGTVCYAPCDASAVDSCGSGRLCIRFGTVVQGFCHDAAASGEACYPAYDNQMCADSTDECIQTGQAGGIAVGVCGKGCPASEVNTGQASCPSGQACLPDVTVEVDESVSTCTSSSLCATSSNFLCRPVGESAGVVERCVRPNGFCAVTIPLSSDLFASPAPEATCSVSGADATRRCGLVGASAPSAIVSCRALGGGSDDGICIAYCNDPGGVGAELSCGTGYSCQDSGYVERQGGAQSPVSCTSGDDSTCNTTEHYTCQSISGQHLCARPLKICKP